MPPKYISPGDIAAAAQAFAKKYDPQGTIPFPIEQVVEFGMKMDIVPIPGLLSEHGIDGFHSLDGKELYIDQEQLEKFYNRARFTMAHETGHLELHSELLTSLQISSIDEWKRLILGRGAGYAPLETQANMFAGFLLMPADTLAERFEVEKEILSKHPFFRNQKLPDDSVLIQYMARPIAKHFDVSEAAAQVRLTNWLRNNN